MDDARPQSLFVVLSFGDLAPYFSSIVLLEKNTNNLEFVAQMTSEGRPKIKRSSSSSSLDTHQNEKEYASHLTSSEDLPDFKRAFSTYSLDLQKDYVAHLTLQSGYPVVFRWTFCASAISGEDLCVVPDFGTSRFPIDAQLKGCLWNLRTKSCKSFNPPKDCSYYEHVASVGEHFYFLTDVFFNPGSFFEPGPLFRRYGPVEGWETLEPFPDDDDDIFGLSASAVFEDTILLKVECKFWAYNVSRNKWYQVRVDDQECYNISGEAVVIENTIYALTEMSSGLVLALSIEKKEINDDLEFSCSLLSKIVVPGMEKNKIWKEDAMCKSRHLVHLGEDNFCLVKSCQSFFFYDYQPIQVTYIKLKKEKGENLMMTVTDISIYKLKIPQEEQFRVMLCFSVPDHKTAAIKEGKGPVLKFNPFPEDYVSEQKDKNQEAEVPQVANVKGHSIYVRNLPRNANVIQVEKELEKFGAIKRDGIQVLKYRKGCYAFVEFECAASKQLAIEASPMIIGGCSAQILEKRASKKRKNKRKEMNRVSV